MSGDDPARPICFRRSDLQIAARAHNMAAMVIGAKGSEQAVIRRLLVVADMLKATAQRLSRRDFEDEAIVLCDDFFARRAAGERGEDDAA
jgi:hypothetical protein